MPISDTPSIVFSECATDHFESEGVGMKAKHRLDYAYYLKVINLFPIC